MKRFAGILCWTLSEGRTLTISSSGALADYAAASDSPWYAQWDNIKEIIVEDGISTIGDRAF